MAESIELDPELQKRIFNSLLETFVLPHVRLRQERKELPTPLQLLAAQVLLYPDERPIEVRVNDEVRVVAEMTLREGVELDIGEPVYSHQLERLTKFELIEPDDLGCGHIIFMQLNGNWTCEFSFIYNRHVIQNHVVAADQFWNTAKYAFEQQYWPVFVDALFSALELAAKALLASFREDMQNSTSHKHVHQRINWYAKLGVIETRYRDLFNRLSQLRPKARYLHEKVALTEAEAKEMLDTVSKMIAEMQYF